MTRSGLLVVLVSLGLAACGSTTTIVTVRRTAPTTTPAPGRAVPGGAASGQATAALKLQSPTTSGTTTTSATTTPRTTTPAPATTTRTTATTNGASAQSPQSALAGASSVVHLATFRSPSKNIGCIIIDGMARCDINHRDWSPPPHPASCPQEVDFGQGLIVGGSGKGAFVCAGDTALDPSAKALAYGSDTLVGSFVCASATTGMTCRNWRTRHGFFISIQSYRAF